MALGTALPWLMAAGSAVSAVSQFSAANYQAQVAKNNAAIMENNAQRENFQIAEDMQDRDRMAAAELGALLAEQSASGINVNSGTFLLRRRSLANLATRDRQRLDRQRQVQLENTLQGAADQRASARQSRTGAILGLVGGLTSVPTSYLSGASMYNEVQYNRNRLEWRA